MAKGKFLKDSSGNKFYPISHTKAIYDNNGALLDTVLNNKIDKDDDTMIHRMVGVGICESAETDYRKVIRLLTPDYAANNFDIMDKSILYVFFTKAQSADPDDGDVTFTFDVDADPVDDISLVSMTAFDNIKGWRPQTMVGFVYTSSDHSYKRIDRVATTTFEGIVKLCDNLTTKDTHRAVTAKAVSDFYDQYLNDVEYLNSNKQDKWIFTASMPTANAYYVARPENPIEYTDGTIITVFLGAKPTSDDITLEVGSLGAKPIFGYDRADSTLLFKMNSADLEQGDVLVLMYRTYEGTLYNRSTGRPVKHGKQQNGYWLALNMPFTYYDDIIDIPDKFNPQSHADTSSVYGMGNGSKYGHVKLSDSVSTSSGAAFGIAATPTAVKKAYEASSYFGVCDTASNVAEKTVTVDDGFELKEGVKIRVDFTQEHTSSQKATLKVNNCVAAPIYYGAGQSVVGGSSSPLWSIDFPVVDLVYSGDGTHGAWAGFNPSLVMDSTRTLQGTVPLYGVDTTTYPNQINLQTLESQTSYLSNLNGITTEGSKAYGVVPNAINALQDGGIYDIYNNTGSTIYGFTVEDVLPYLNYTLNVTIPNGGHATVYINPIEFGSNGSFTNKQAFVLKTES